MVAAWVIYCGSLPFAVAGFLWGSSSTVSTGLLPPNYSADYGVDISFPIHGPIRQDSVFKKQYDDSMKGCYQAYSQRECDGNEQARIEMNRDQPKTQHNYTEMGFLKTKVPKGAWEPLLKFYQQYKDSGEKVENWPRGNTYVNHWESPSYMISLEDRNLRGGVNVKEQIWNSVKPMIEEWTGKKLTETSLYGIRVYKAGAILATHVDRLPLVSSCIIQVDQDLDEPWPVEVYSHDGKAYNVTMEPGDMVLYESHTVLHGRPFPLKGRRYANVFVHYIPVDHDDENAHDRDRPKGTAATARVYNNKVGGHEHDNHDAAAVAKHMQAIDASVGAEAQIDTLETPKLVVAPDAGAATTEEVDALVEKIEEEIGGVLEEGGRDQEGLEAGAGEEPYEEEEEEEEYFEERLEEEEEQELEDEEAVELHLEEVGSTPDGRTALHIAAQEGNLEAVQGILQNQHTDILSARDANDWQAIHEAASEGHIDVLKYLLDMGADVGAKTNNGGTVLWWAKRSLEADHPVIEYLESIGAPDEGEDLEDMEEMGLTE